MEKEKLIELLRSQNNELDEREKAIKDVSYRWGYLGVYIILALLYVIRIIKGVEFSADLLMVMMAQSGFISLSLYKNGRNKRLNLLFIILSALICIAGFILTLGYYGFF